jgi:hypothetical protein
MPPRPAEYVASVGVFGAGIGAHGLAVPAPRWLSFAREAAGTDGGVE